MLIDLTNWVMDVVESLGYIGVALLVAIENLFPPIPSEVVLSLAGAVAGRGDAWAVGMVIAATIGSLVGAWILYGISAAIGPDRLRLFVIRYGKWFRIKESDLDRTEAWFEHRSGSAVLICRCIPLVRSLISIPAGFVRMPILKFTVLTVIGSAVWNTALISAGFVLGDNWEQVEGWISYFQYLVVAVIVLAVAWFVWTRFIRPKPGLTEAS